MILLVRRFVFFVLIGNRKNDLYLTMTRQKKNEHYQRQYFVNILMYHAIKPTICEIISMSKTVWLKPAFIIGYTPSLHPPPTSDITWLVIKTFLYHPIMKQKSFMLACHKKKHERHCKDFSSAVFICTWLLIGFWQTFMGLVVRGMVFNATFKNISVILFYWWWKPEYPEKTTDNLYHIMLYQYTSSELNSNSQR